MFIPIQSERVRGVDVTENFCTIKWRDGTIGVVSRKEALDLARALRLGHQYDLTPGGANYVEDK